MRPSSPPVDPAAWLDALTGWQRQLVDELLATVRKSTRLEAAVRGGDLVFLSNGPALAFRVEPDRVRFALWRGRSMRDIEPRLEPEGAGDRAAVSLREGQTIDPATVRRLVKKAMRLNAALGDPTRI